jgi:hypothetical protein
LVAEELVYKKILTENQHEKLKGYVEDKYTLKDVDISKETSLTPTGPQEKIVITRRYGVPTIFPNDDGSV